MPRPTPKAGSPRSKKRTASRPQPSAVAARPTRTTRASRDHSPPQVSPAVMRRWTPPSSPGRSVMPAGGGSPPSWMDTARVIGGAGGGLLGDGVGAASGALDDRRSLEDAAPLEQLV